MINMIAGIIIDSFGELRNVYNRAQEDKATRCFVCGVNAAEFNRRASGFDKHVMSQHNMWHYLFFRHYLRKKVHMASLTRIPATSLPQHQPPPLPTAASPEFLSLHPFPQDENEYTGQESFVSDMIKQGSLTYVPNGHALALQRGRWHG